MCNDCSCHLELDVACESHVPLTRQESFIIYLFHLVNLIKSIDSNTSHTSTAGSTNSPLDTGKEPETLRTCDHCFHLLMTCKEKQDAREKDVPIKRLYDRIATIRSGVAPDIPNYSKIIKSLYDGDSHHTLAEASALREKLGRSAELMDGVSKHVLALPCAVGSREEALKKAIRLACVRYIKEEMLAIPPIPLEAEIKKLQGKRLQETARNIERDRRLAMEAFEKYELSGRNNSYPASCHSDSSSELRRGPNTPSKSSTASGSTLRAVDNWSGFQSQSTGNKQFGAELDPLVVQMQIIKGYIKQAKEAMRFEEVTTLEANLRELQQEYYNQKLNTEGRA
jgi:rabenosyn-5